MRSILILAVMVPLLWAAAPVPTPRTVTIDNPRPKVLTGKERLSGKATDEQRVNDCKVPPALRGAKDRPTACGPKAARSKDTRPTPSE